MKIIRCHVLVFVILIMSFALSACKLVGTTMEAHPYEYNYHWSDKHPL